MENDARNRYTRMRIREAFWEKIKKKPIEKITVKEICEKAEINRTTFITITMMFMMFMSGYRKKRLPNSESWYGIRRTQPKYRGNDSAHSENDKRRDS